MHIRPAVVLVILAATLLAPTLHATTIIGRATVTDGDTVEIRGQRIRLFGIDAPESAQPCQDARGATYRCGQRAAMALADRVGARTVSCVVRDTDRYGRSVAECSEGGVNLNAWLVRNGWAVAYRRYGGGRYDADERAAKAARAGVWAGPFVMPEDYRRGGSRAHSASMSPAERLVRTPPFTTSTSTNMSPAERLANMPQSTNSASAHRMNCTQLRIAGLAPVRRGSPHYHSAIDGDGDGVGCE